MSIAGPADITPSEDGPGLFDFRFDDAPMSTVVAVFQNICASYLEETVAVIPCPPDRVSARFSGVPLRYGFAKILTVTGRRDVLLPYFTESRHTVTYKVVPSIDRKRLSYALFAQACTNGISTGDTLFGLTSKEINITCIYNNRPLPDILSAIAESAKINLAYSSSDFANSTVSLEEKNVPWQEVLLKVIRNYELRLYAWPVNNCFVIAREYPPLSSEPVMTCQGQAEKIDNSHSQGAEEQDQSR